VRGYACGGSDHIVKLLCRGGIPAWKPTLLSKPDTRLSLLKVQQLVEPTYGNLAETVHGGRVELRGAHRHQQPSQECIVVTAYATRGAEAVTKRL
jgi:hypothetical protein